MKTTFLLALAISSAAYSQANFAGSINDTYTKGDTLTAAKLENIKTAVNDNDARSLPDGVTPGDLLYWNGSVWNLTPASIACSSGDANLKLTAGVPTWTCSASTVYKIGDWGPGGGTVFYVADGGLHGLEVARVPPTYANWGCEGIPIPGAYGEGIGTGQHNTDAILADCSTTSSAAMIADEYYQYGTVTETGTNMYSDWFMPSLAELKQMCLADKGIHTNSAGAEVFGVITVFSGMGVRVLWSSSDSVVTVEGPSAVDWDTCERVSTVLGDAHAYRVEKVRAF